MSHLKCGSRSVWGRAGEAVAALEAARAEGLDVAADQYPYTAAATTLAIVLPPALLGLGVDECVAALCRPRRPRRGSAREMERGISGWENVATDPGWTGFRISSAASHPDWAGRSIAELADEAGMDPADFAFDALIDDRLDVQIVLECMDEADVEAILAVPWIAVCTDAEGRRPGHPILDAGRPHPRTYGSTARVLGRYVRERATLSLETRGRQADLRAGGATRPRATAASFARAPRPTSSSSIRATVADVATYVEPARHPVGIDHVDRQRPDGDPRRGRDRGAFGPVAGRLFARAA